MRYMEGNNRSQREILPLSLEERISPNHPICVIDVFVDGLNMEALAFLHAEPAETGRMAVSVNNGVPRQGGVAVVQYSKSP